MSFGLAIDHLQIAIPVGGEAAGRKFFCDLLELEEIAKPSTLAERGGVWFGVGKQQIHLGVDHNFLPSEKAHVAIATNALARLRARLENAGFVTYDDEPVNGRTRFFTKDPFGNRIEFMDAADL
jgi:catechol 2,3-dioxygenase-like lactoylglutathione lyase family enzyme